MNLSIDDLDDFEIPTVKKKRIKFVQKSKQLKENVRDKSNESIFRENNNLESSIKEDADISCPTCARKFDPVSLIEHISKCQEANSKVAQSLMNGTSKEFSSKVETCPVCKKSLINFSQLKQSWHINKCLDNDNSLNCKKNIKKSIQKVFTKIPNSRYDEKLVLAKTLSVSTIQELKDKKKRLKKEIIVPKMVQFSPKTVVRNRKFVQDLIVSKKLEFFDSESLPDFVNLKTCEKRLSLSMSCEINDLNAIFTLSGEFLKFLNITSSE